MDKELRMLEDLMELDEGGLVFDAQLEDLEEWDSMSRLALMLEVKKTFGKNLTVEELQAFVTVRDICEYLHSCAK